MKQPVTDEPRELLKGLPSGVGRSAGRTRQRRFGRLQRRHWVATAISLNLTPMIDTVFNLLFLFMIISRFGAQEGMLPAKLPAAQAAAAAVVSTEIPRTPIRIHLRPVAGSSDCLATVERFAETPVAPDGLAAVMRQISQQGGFDANTPVHLFADDRIAWDHVVNAYNAALANGFSKIYFAGGS